MVEMAAEFFECACYSDEHTLKFSYDPEYNELYTSVYLNQYCNVLRRIWVALKYVLGYRSRYGHWDCFIMRAEDGERLKALAEKLIEGRKEAESRESHHRGAGSAEVAPEPKQVSRE